MYKVHQIILNDQNDKVLSPFCQIAQQTIIQGLKQDHHLWGRDELEELMKKEYGQEVVVILNFHLVTVTRYQQ